jgi:hypothetical protein
MMRVRLLALILTVGAAFQVGCGGRKPVPQEDAIPLVSMDRLQESAPRLRAGMARAEVLALLGPCSLETPLAAKDSPVKSGTELAYYVVLAKPDRINEKTDKWLTVYLDEFDRVKRVRSNISGIMIDKALASTQ